MIPQAMNPRLTELEFELSRKAEHDPAFRQRLTEDPQEALAQAGFRLPAYARVCLEGQRVSLSTPAAPSLDPRPTFFEPQLFPGLEAFRSRWAQLQTEARSVIAEMVRFDLFYPDHFRRDSLLECGSRGRFLLWWVGMRLEANQRRCPLTAELCWGLPGLVSAGFYLLGPQTRMLPHTGTRSDILRAHLGLVVPPDCCLKVGFDERPWREGEFLVFDDTHLHEAWNRSDEYRCVLHLDFFARPLPDVQHAAVVRDLRSRLLKGGPGYHPWILAAEPKTDADHLALLEKARGSQPQAVAVAEQLAAEHGVFL